MFARLPVFPRGYGNLSVFQASVSRPEYSQRQPRQSVESQHGSDDRCVHSKKYPDRDLEHQHALMLPESLHATLRLMQRLALLISP
ncbi:MAG: hypothetical protein H6716_17235 [Polyangiaceae bacterium]|nr:hypothetical protein [Polyangiaceae bacterium]MCB9608336.1 hypothetical protein [Polyangiaceae bacterium]